MTHKRVVPMVSAAAYRAFKLNFAVILGAERAVDTAVERKTAAHRVSLTENRSCFSSQRNVVASSGETSSFSPQAR